MGILRKMLLKLELEDTEKKNAKICVCRKVY